MWGSIGGYIGILLGVSIVRLPNMIHDIFNLLNGLVRKHANRITAAGEY